MKLFVNGCSMTFGDGLLDKKPLDGHTYRPEVREELEKMRWSGQMLNHINFNEVINLSSGASGNDRIVRTTLEYFLKKIRNKEDLSDHVVIIQFSCPFRFEIYNDDLQIWEKIWPEPNPDKPNSPRTTLQVHYAWSSTRADLNSLMRHVVTLGEFFERHDIRYMFTSMNNLLEENYKQYDEYLQILEYIQEYNWYNKTPDSCGMFGMPGWVGIPGDGHPDAATHKLIAKLFADDLLKFYPELKQNTPQHPTPAVMKEHIPESLNLPHNVCVCSFTEIDENTKNVIRSKMRTHDNVRFIHGSLPSNVNPITYLENLIPFEDKKYQPFDYTYEFLEDEIEFYYKLLGLAKKKSAIELEHNIFFDYVLFVNDTNGVKDIKIPSFIGLNSIYANIFYERRDLRIDKNLFLCDTITFNTIGNFFKFLKKTDTRFFQEDQTPQYFFHNCIRMSNISVNEVRECYTA